MGVVDLEVGVVVLETGVVVQEVDVVVLGEDVVVLEEDVVVQEVDMEVNMYLRVSDKDPTLNSPTNATEKEPNVSEVKKVCEWDPVHLTVRLSEKKCKTKTKNIFLRNTHSSPSLSPEQSLSHIVDIAASSTYVSSE